MYDVIIIGAGPAGMTSALYLLRANKKVLLLEEKVYGGQIINSNLVENYPGIPNISGFNFATNLFNQIKELGVDYKNEKVIKIEGTKVITSNNSYECKKIIIATGVVNKKLGIEDEYIGKGVSYCATCDGNFYKNKIVAVIGGGNTALEDALYLSNICERVYLIHRRDTFKGEIRYLDEIKNKSNIEIITNSNVIKLNGVDKLEGIELDTGKKIEIAGLFIAIGQVPNNDIFSNIIELEDGYIKSIDGVHTTNKDIYVAGDVRKKDLRQLTTAVSDGSIAATICIKEMI
ncbi:MAG: FAD-dependent oxidoreductase [Bacilli bacterium]|nr:FAD-dependent oxidoreductase [Bacilli bacterium]